MRPLVATRSFRIVSFLLAIVFLTSNSMQAQVKFAGTQFNIAGNTLASPSGVAVDGKGNVYIADRGNNRIVSVTPSTNGTGTVATVLDGLSAPSGITSDWSGNLYIADTGNNRILFLPMTRNGLGAPLQVGAGLNSPTAVAVDAAANVYVADSGSNRILELPRIGNSYGSALPLITGLSNPSGVAIDGARNIYIADTGNNRVLKVAYSAAGYLTQQTLSRGLSAPMGVAVDSSYNVYISDTGNDRILEEPWFAGAKRYNAQLVIGSDVASPAGVVRDWDGNVYVADLGNNQVIEVVTTSVNFGSYNVGTGGSIQTYNFNIMAGTVIDSVSIYTNGAADKDFTDGGSSTCTAQTYDVATSCGVSVSFLPSGSGMRTGAIVMYDSQGNSLATTFIAGNGILAKPAFLPGTRTILGTQLSAPSGVAVDGNGNVYIADTGNNRVLELLSNGNSYTSQSILPLTRLDSPMGVAIDGAGNLYVASNGNDTILRLPLTERGYGTQSKISGNFYGPTGVTTDSGGNLFIADTLDQFMFRLTWAGNAFSIAQHLGGNVKCPLGVAVNANKTVYFTMPYYNSIQAVPLIDNKYLTQFQTQGARTSLPSALAVDGNSNLYILDTGNNRVVMLQWNGTGFGNQVTVADGFNAPSGLAVDLSGNLYVADTGNNQVVKIDLSTPQPLGFADTYLGSTSSDSNKTITVVNTGNLPLTFASVDFPADFPNDPKSLNPCTESSVVGQGASCQLAIDFTPVATGSPLTEALNLQFAGTTNQLSINLSGSSIGKQAQSITFPTISDVTYGTGSIQLSAAASSGLPVTYKIISGPATVNRGGTALTVHGTGMVIVQAMLAGTATYGAASNVTCSFQVIPAVLTVTPLNTTATYGVMPTSFNYTVTGFVNGESASRVLTGKANVRSSGGPSQAAGTFVLTADQGSLASANYTFAFAPGTLTVNPAQLIIKAASNSTIYSAATPKLGWTYIGFVNGDGPASVSGTPAISSAADRHSQTGTYAITPSIGTLSSKNYNFVFVGGTLTVTPAQLTVTANNQSVTYGQTLPSMTYSITGFIAGDTAATSFTGTPAMMTKTSAQSSAGTYPVIPVIGTLNSHNYSFSFVAGTIFINKAVLIIQPANATMTYGGHIPALTYTIVGLVGADTRNTAMSGAPTLNTSATSATKPGTAIITAVLGSLSSRNYSFIFNSGTMTINKAILTVQAKSASMTYGSKLPAFIYSFSGFVNGDSANTVSGAPSLTSQALSSSKVGTYAINGQNGTLSSDRYSFHVIGSTLAIARAVLNVSPDPASMIYGGQLPAFSYKISGFMNNDNNNVVTGKPIFKTVTTSRTHTGSYALQGLLGSLASANYSFVVNNGVVVVKKAQLTVVPDSASMTYGGAIPVLTYKFKGLINGDTASCISGIANLRSSANDNSYVGQYVIHATQVSLSASDYNFVFADGALAVNKAILTVIPDQLSMSYGGAVPVATYKLSGLVNHDTSRVVSGSPVFKANASSASPVGTYIVQGGVGTLVAGDYTFVVKNGQIVVGKAVLTVTPNAASVTYGTALPPFTYAINGFVNGDTVRKVSGVATVSTAASSSSTTGVYALTATVAKLSATNYSFVAGKGLLTVTKAALTVTPTPLVITYGGNLPALTYTVSGFVYGDTIGVVKGVATVATSATSASSAGSYALNATVNKMTATNYTFTAGIGALTINKAVLTVTAADASMTYGGAIPSLNASISGFVKDDTQASAVTGTANVTTNAVASSLVANYTTSAAIGTLASANYIFQFQSGKLVVNKAQLTITADSLSMKAGAAVPALTYSVSGLVKGDTKAKAAIGAPVLATTATASSIAGSYAITAGQGTMQSANYSLAFANGTLTVN